MRGEWELVFVMAAVAAMVLLAPLAASTTSEAAEPPAIFWVSEPVQPGEAALVTGAFLDDVKKIEIVLIPGGAEGVPADKPFEWPGGGREAAPIQACATSVKFLVPEDLGAGLYAVRIANGAGWSRAVLLNRASPWWLQGNLGETASPGGWVRILGNCLAGKDPSSVKVFLEGKGTFPVKDAGPHSLLCELPKDLAEGEYKVRVHAGAGGSAGWSVPLKLAVRAEKSWPSTIFNVVDFGADSTGVKDSTAAVKAALEKAAQGGVVYFPRGRYGVTEALHLPRFTTLRGEGRALTCVFWPDMEQPLKELIKGTNSFAVEDMTLYCSNYIHFIAADQNVPDAGDVRIRRLCIRADMYRGHLKPEEVDRRFRAALKNSSGGGDLLRLGGRNVEVLDCDLYASGRSIFLDRVKCARIANNTIYNGRWGWYCFMGSDGLIFENNVMAGADLMSTGGGLANYVTAYSRCIYFGRNTFKNMLGWDREAITSDAGGGAYYGRVASADAAGLVLAQEPTWGKRDWTGAGVFVVSGRGQGQWRDVARYEKTRVDVDRPWDVAPDATSLVEITMQHRHYLMAGNEFFDAGIGVQFYGTAVEHIVAGCKTTRAGGFNNIGKPYGGYHLPPDQNPCHQPSWRVQYFDNEILEGNMYRGHANNAVAAGDSHLGVFGWPIKPDWPWPYNVGTIVRRSVLHNNAKIHAGTGQKAEFPSVADCIIENNVVRDSNIGIQLDAGTTGILLRGNRFEQVKNPMTGGGVARAHVHPAELALARLRGILCYLPGTGPRTVSPKWAQAEKKLHELCARPAQDPALAGEIKAASAAAMSALARAFPSGYSPEFLENVLGLKVEPAKDDKLGPLLESGTGGGAALGLSVSLAEGFADTTVRLKMAVPPGWVCDNPISTPVVLNAAEKVKTASFPVKVPAGAWGAQALKVELEAAAGEARFQGVLKIPVGGAFVREWLIIGPFANQAKQALDPAAHPPENELDLTASHPGLPGPVKWQPASIGGNCLDFGRLFNTNQPATAYALACLVAEEDQRVTFGLGCDDGARVWVNGEEVFSRAQGGRAQARQEKAPAQLVKGENVVFCKSSNVSASWQVFLSLEDGSEALKKVRLVPADRLAALKVFAAAKRDKGVSATVPGGPFAYEGEIEWTPVFEDDFSRLTLGGNWKAVRGNWAISNGKLITRETGIIAILKTVKPPLRIEFDARSENPGDLTAFWGTAEKGYEGGYFMGFGSNGNTLNKILRYGAQVAESSSVLAQKGKWHHVAAQVVALPEGAAAVELIVDGRLALRYKDPKGVTDAETPGLIAWSEGEFARVKVYQGKTRADGAAKK